MTNPDCICMNCMKELDEPKSVCPHCGFDNASCENAANQLECGSILAGTYLVGCALGQGGFGITYTGMDLNLELKVAIKEYYPEGFVTRDGRTHTTVHPLPGERKTLFERGKEKFVSEARVLAKFSEDPSIVGVRGFFQENGTAYIVMNFVEGETLKAYAARRGGKLPSAEVLKMMEPLFASLSRVHAAGLLHRDISPDNIMRRDDGSVVLLDFGAARQMSIEGEHSNTINVKHGFAPEEQYRTRGEQGPWTDVYALCATIYRLTTGVTPQQALDRAMSDAPLLPPDKLGADFTTAQQQAILHGLAIRAEHRTQTIVQLQSELKGTQAPAAKPSVPETRAGQTNKSANPVLEDHPKHTQPRRKAALFTIASVAVFVVVVVAFILMFMRDQTKDGVSFLSNDASVTDESAATKETPFQQTPTLEAATVAGQTYDAQTAVLPAELHIAMITDGGNVNDKSYNEASWVGCSKWAAENGTDATYYQPSEDSDQARIKAIQTAIENGANVVVCSNFTFGAVLQQVPQQYPNVMFLGVDLGLGDVPGLQANTSLVSFREEQGGYLAGYAAVMDGYTRLAFIGGMPVAAVVRYGYGFIQGANQAAEELGIADQVSIEYWYSNFFVANDEVYSKARALYGEGTQIIFSVGGGIVYSIMAAADDTDSKLIGCDVDLSELSDCIVTTAVKNIENAVKLALSDLQANGGTWSAAFAGNENKLGAAQDCVNLPVYTAAWRFSNFSIDQYLTLYNKLKSGAYTVAENVDRQPKADIRVNYLNE